MVGLNIFKYITEPTVWLFKAEAYWISDGRSLCDYGLEMRVRGAVLFERRDGHELLSDLTRLGVFESVCWHMFYLSILKFLPVMLLTNSTKSSASPFLPCSTRKMTAALTPAVVPLTAP